MVKQLELRPGLILLIDNYDSFTYNLAHALAELGRRDVEIVRNDQLTVAEAQGPHVGHIIMSPGPCGPEEAGICLPLARQLISADAGRPAVPLLGICLGHQVIGMAAGFAVGRAYVPVHGKVSLVHHAETPDQIRQLNGALAPPTHSRASSKVYPHHSRRPGTTRSV